MVTILGSQVANATSQLTSLLSFRVTALKRQCTLVVLLKKLTLLADGWKTQKSPSESAHSKLIKDD
jgi:hypothetical protein